MGQAIPYDSCCFFALIHNPDSIVQAQSARLLTLTKVLWIMHYDRKFPLMSRHSDESGYSHIMQVMCACATAS